MGMEAANPNNWSVGDIALVGGFIASAILWWKKNPWRKLKNIWQAPDRVQEMLSKMDMIYAAVSLALAMNQNTWRIIARPLWQADPDGKWIHTNNFMLKLLSRQENELAGNGWLNSIHEQDRERVFAEWNIAIENKTNFYLHFRLVSAAGESIPVIGEAFRLTDTQGNILGYMGCISLIDK